MARDSMGELQIFIAVARERSFTKAAAKLGMSQSAMSHAMSQLEARLGVRLLTRTTRAVSMTEAGERFFEGITPHFEGIDAEIDALSAMRDTPAGTIRITASDHSINYLIWPKLVPFLRRFPDIRVELLRDNGLVDIVGERLDAGVRLGEQLAKDMISARIGPDLRFAVVGSASYLAENPAPDHPQDLTRHRCINERLPTMGGFWAWEFEEGGREIRVRVDGQLAFNTSFNAIDAALEGFGLAYVPEDVAAPHLASGKLVRLLEPFCPYWDGYHLYYPSRRQSSPAFIALVDALRHRR